MSGPCADASQAIALAGAERALQAGGNSVDAVLSGFFAAAAGDPSVLLGSVVALVAGVGAPARLIDGRVCQPGLGSKRPRGLLAGQPVPAAARVAVPRSLGAMTLLHAYGASRALSTAIRPAVTLAKKQGAPKRAALLDAVAQTGGGALSRTTVERALLASGGTIAGGLLSSEDLGAARPVEMRVELREAGLLQIGLAELEACAPSDRAARPAEVVVAADVHGLVCALAYHPDADALLVPELEICLSIDAIVVRRGVPRTAPQTPLFAPAPIAILARPGKSWRAAVAAVTADTLNAEVFAADVPLLDMLRAQLLNGARCALAASVARRATQLTRCD